MEMKILPFKALRVRTKNEENFGKCQENIEIFDQNLYGKLTFLIISN